MKTLCIILILITNILGGSMPRYTQINDYFDKSTSIIAYVDGKKINYDNTSKEYTDILTILSNMCVGSRDLPALGVSLHEETIQAINENIWIELKYPKILYHNEMPFDSLLINVMPNYMGFDLIRGQEGKYEGRCFHLSINGYTLPLYNYLVELK